MDKDSFLRPNKHELFALVQIQFTLGQPAGEPDQKSLLSVTSTVSFSETGEA